MRVVYCWIITRGKMMTKDEALKMAILLLECPHITEGRINVIVDACKEALEQPAQDYVFICKRCGDDLGLEYALETGEAYEWKHGAGSTT